LYGAQSLMILAMVAVLRVSSSGLSDPPVLAPAIAEAAPEAELNSGARYDDTLILDRFAGWLDEQNRLHLWLTWQSSGQLHSPYYQSLLPVGTDAVATAATLQQPFNQQFPTTCWRPESGEIDQYVLLPLDPSIGTDEVWVSLSWVDGDTGEPLPVVEASGQSATQTGIGPFFPAD
ncbi:MAG: hypothetical protein GYB68_10085, partial [Chloroflexi bacterium]|nr:hypothetical protein [Chloroflexota bacterium]